MAIDPATVTVILTCALIIERVYTHTLAQIKRSSCCGAEMETRDEIKQIPKNELPKLDEKKDSISV